MKLKSNYKLREVAGETIVVNQGQSGVNMTRIISLNSSAKLLYNEFMGKEFTVEDVAKVLVDTYSIDHSLALKDATKWIDSLKHAEIIE